MMNDTQTSKPSHHENDHNQLHEVKSNEQENISKRVLYTVLVGFLVCLVLLLCITAAGFYYRRLRRKNFSVRNVVYRVKNRMKPRRRSRDASTSSAAQPIDEDLSKKAEIFHYQQTKKNIGDFLRQIPPPSPLARRFKPQDGATPLLLTDGDTSDGDLSVYGYPGIAAALEEPTEIHNPLFDDLAGAYVASDSEKMTLKAQVIREFGHTDVTAYGSIGRTLAALKD